MKHAVASDDRIIVEDDDGEALYRLGYPNREVRLALNELLRALSRETRPCRLRGGPRLTPRHSAGVVEAGGLPSH